MKLSPKKALLNRLIDSLDRISLGAYLSPLHGARSYETEFMGDGRKLSFPWRYSFSLNEIMYRYIGFGFILPYEATKQSSSINNCSIIPTESCWARS